MPWFFAVNWRGMVRSGGRRPSGRRVVPGRAGRGLGFSLLEMLFVVAIIGLIAALVLPNLRGGFGKGQVSTTKAQIALLAGAVERFRLDVGRYPAESEGLQSLLEKPSEAEGWNGPYLDKDTMPKDGWSRAFIYKEGEGGRFVVRSLGADGKEGGEGEAADLDNRR